MDNLFDDNSKQVVSFEICDSPERNLAFKNVIDNHHRYMKYKDTCNRRINWLIYESESGNLIGATGINSAILALGERDKFIGWDRDIKSKNITMVANNYRFALIRENITVDNVGGQILKTLRRLSPILWQARYNNLLVLLESLVKPPWTGAIYKADNWILIGKTKGFSFSKAPVASWKKETGKRGYMARHQTEESIKKYAVGGTLTAVSKSEPKLIFIKPIHHNWREILLSKGSFDA